MTEPVVQETSEFYSARPSFETHPEDDPEMTVRVEDWARRYEPDVRRAMKLKGYGWMVVSGPQEWVGVWREEQEIASWPVAHPLTYSTAFRHAETRRDLERAAAGQLEGDMGVEAFRG